MRYFLCILFVIFFQPLAALVDLEDSIQSFVLETKQIHIPDHPDAFNPGIIRWNGRLLMVFREIPNPKQTFNSDLYLVWLDENYDPVGECQKLETREPSSLIPSRAEDARLIDIDGHLYIIYSDNCDEKVTRGGFRVYVSELIQDDGMFIMNGRECLSRFDGESKLLREKNWSPFCYEKELLLEYSLDPHKIFRPILGTGACETVCETESVIKWPWGILRGGTPALLEEGQYLAFFHSSMDMPTVHSLGAPILHYFMGAYTFSSKPPFQITRVSPEPIVGKGFYHGAVPKPYWKPLRVVFPGGFVMDDKFIWVVYGRQDRELWVVKMDKKGLMSSLVPVVNSKGKPQKPRGKEIHKGGFGGLRKFNAKTRRREDRKEVLGG